LTPEQEAKIPEYTRVGIEIGLATGPELDEAVVRQLTDDHREMCGVPRATEFLVYDSPMAAVEAVEGLTPSNALRVECGKVEETKEIVYLLELAKRVGWMWMNETTTIVTRRAAEIHLLDKVNGTRVLHNENDYALRYIDGRGVYALNGLRVPRSESWVVTTPAEQLDVQRVLGIIRSYVRKY
jgi:hypothetical protein